MGETSFRSLLRQITVTPANGQENNFAALQPVYRRLLVAVN
jgi:hypothetical protein